MLESHVYQLVNCDDIRSINHTHCTHFIACSTDWELRLVNGGSSLEGRVEVCLNGVWGTICDTSWDDEDGGVACSQLGYSRRGK